MAAVMSEQIPIRPGSQYTLAQIQEAAAHYVVTGKNTAVERLTGIPNQTISDWHKADWWQKLLGRIREEKQDEIDALYTDFIHKGVNAQLDRLENGDYVLDKKGNQVRKPVSLRDVTMSVAISFDKRQIGRNLPTTISATNSNALKELQAQFQALTGRVVEGETLAVECTDSSHPVDKSVSD